MPSFRNSRASSNDPVTLCPNSLGPRSIGLSAGVPGGKRSPAIATTQARPKVFQQVRIPQPSRQETLAPVAAQANTQPQTGGPAIRSSLPAKSQLEVPD